MSQKIASLYATIGADTSGFEAGSKKVKAGLDQQAAAFAKFSADATRNAKSFVSYEAQKAKAIAATERAIAKEAKEQERVAKAAAKAAEAQRKASLSIAPGIERGTKSLQEFTQANAGLLSVATIAAGAVLGIGVAINKTIEGVVRYGDEVQKLKTITGQSAEQTSNTIQLADDARISYEKLAVALQFASKKGVDTSINGLAKLSEQYKALAPGIERTKFLTDTFGKSGVEMGKILEMDATAIRNFKANAGQILTESDLRSIKSYNVALDNLKDNFEAFGNSVGKAAIPFKTDLLNGINVFIRATETSIEKQGLWKTGLFDIIKGTDEAAKEISDEQAAMLSAGDAASDLGDDLDGLSSKQETAEETAKRLTSTYTSLLSSMFSIQKQNDSYAKTVEDIAKKDEELTNKKSQLTLKMWEEQRAGKLTNDENLQYVQQLAEITSAQEENAKAKQNAEEDNKKASQQRVYDLAQQKLAADGVVTSGEYEYLQNLAVNYGLVSRSAADNAIAEEQRAQSLVNSFEQTLPPMEQTLSVMQQIAGYNGTTVNFGVNFQSNTPPQSYSVPGASYDSYNPQASPGGYGYAANYATGTNDWMTVPSGYPNDSYGVGLTSGEQYFVKPAGGGMGGGGDTYNIVIHNPVPEKSADSVRQALIRKSATGRSS